MADAKHTPELLPCPFCGSTDLTLDNLVDADDFFVSCKICEIQQIANYTKAQAVALWNKRPALSVAAPDLLARGQALSFQLRAIIRNLDGQAYSSTLSALNDFDAVISKATGTP